MTECKKIRIYHRSLCAGDLDRKIAIKTRTTPGMTTSAGIDQDFDTTNSVWSALKTTKGRSMFYTTNLDKAVSHVFYIRYIDGLTQESWIDYGGELYDIIDIDNYDERDEWMALMCNVRGEDDVEANYA